MPRDSASGLCKVDPRSSRRTHPRQRLSWIVMGFHRPQLRQDIPVRQAVRGGAARFSRFRRSHRPWQVSSHRLSDVAPSVVSLRARAGLVSRASRAANRSSRCRAPDHTDERVAAPPRIAQAAQRCLGRTPLPASSDPPYRVTGVKSGHQRGCKRNIGRLESLIGFSQFI